MPKPLNSVSMTPGSPIRPKALQSALHPLGHDLCPQHRKPSKSWLTPIPLHGPLGSLDQITRTQHRVLQHNSQVISIPTAWHIAPHQRQAASLASHNAPQP